MVMVAVTCPQCGGSLDLATVRRGLVQCGNCETWSVLDTTRDHARRIDVVRTPATTSHTELRRKLEAELTKAGIDPLPEIRLETQVIRYIGRRGRVRVTPYHRERHQPVDEHASIREGVFAIPLDEREEGQLLYYEDVDGLEFDDGPVPDDLEDKLLYFEDRIEVVVRDTAETDLFEKTKPLRYTYRWESSCKWHDEVLLVAVPVAVLRFEYFDTDDTWTQMWSNTRADGKYEVAYSVDDAREVRRQIPTKGRNVRVLLGGLLLVVFAMPLVSGVLTVLAMVFIFCMGVLGPLFGL